MQLTRRHTLAPDVLAALLCAAPGDAPDVTTRLRDPLFARLAASLGPSAPERLDAYSLDHEGARRFSSPFAWSARASRRAIGTAAARHAAATATSPLDAAREEVERLCDRALRGLARRGALSTWLAGAPREVRATCAVEAASWATRLLHLVEPLGAHPLAVGVPDAYVSVPATRISLVGRRDVAGTGPRPGLLRVRDGAPPGSAADGLCVDGLVAALATGSAPARAIGAWPDAGIVLIVELDGEALCHAARCLVGAASASGPRARSDVVTLAA